MNIQIFGKKNCHETKKAERFFKDRGISYHFVNLSEKGISPGEIKSVLNSGIKPEDLLNTEGQEYKRLQLQYMKFDIIEKLLENPLLMRTPIVRNGKKASVGSCPEIWSEWLKA